MQDILAPLHNFIIAAAATPPGKVKPKPDAACWQAQQLATKSILQAGPMAQPDPSKPFILKVDASALGSAAVLMQPADNGELVVCGFASHRWSAVQRRWSVTDWEGFGCILGFARWGHLMSSTRTTNLLI
jgi:hypothetical protein